MFSKETNEFLYVPFNSDYGINPSIKALLTTDEFFMKCYVTPSKKDSDGVICEDAEMRFFRWIETNDRAIYTIKGDAGTGKSTFLHYLQYVSNLNDASVRWEIIDIQTANAIIDFLGLRIEVPNFNLLHGKIMSAIIAKILSLVFSNLNPKTNVHVEEMVNNLRKICRNYKRISKFFPEEVLVKVFHTPSIWKYLEEQEHISTENIYQFAQDLREIFLKVFDENTPLQQLHTLLTLYNTLLFAHEHSEKHILAFDNLERFIGADEIHNGQIDQFVRQLRNCLDTFNGGDPSFSCKIQCVVLIRNTTARMIHTPLHLVDHPGHDIDISGWFPIEEIITKKINWYHEHDISITNEKYISYIFGDQAFDGNGRISAQIRLEYLFNRDKRLVLEFISRIIARANRDILEFFVKCANRGTEFSKAFARQMLMRMVLDELQKEGLWQNLMVESGHDITNRLGYARKILTILHHYKLDNHYAYMNFDDFVQSLDGGIYNHNNTELIDNYFDANAQSRRMIISQILYHMSYYNVRTNNWLQFIDIQLQTDEACVRILDAKDLHKLIDEKHEQIGLRITLSGTTYLTYLIHTFEYFSCRLSGDRTLPLPCAVPTLHELREKEIDDLLCLKIIKRVSDDMCACIKIIDQRNEDSFDIPFKRKKNETPVTHTQRISTAYQRYIYNFIKYVEEEFSGVSLSSSDLEKYNQLLNRLKEAACFVNKP